MNTRIRYIKEGDILKSSRYVQTNEGEARVTIITNELLANIEYGSPIAVAQVTGASLHKVKMAVKAKLVELGAVFEPEKRNHAD